MNDKHREIEKAVVELVDDAPDGLTIQELRKRVIDRVEGVDEGDVDDSVYNFEQVRVELTADGDKYVKMTEDTGKTVLPSTISPEDLLLGEGTGEKYEHLEIREENPNNPLIPETSAYIRRPLTSETEGGRSPVKAKKTDVVILSRALSDDTPRGAENVILTGLPGVGKNHLVSDIGCRTNRGVVRIPSSRDIRFEDLMGHYAPTESGDFEKRDGLLTITAKYGHIAVIDEINMADASINAVLHNATEAIKDRYLVHRMTNEIITPHPEFRVIGTMNPVDFAGTKQLNEAFEDRFRVIEIPHLEPKGEKRVLASQVTGLDADHPSLDPILEIAGQARKAYKRHELSRSITTRTLLDVCDYFVDGFMEPKEALWFVIDNKFPDEDIDELSRIIDWNRFK